MATISGGISVKSTVSGNISQKPNIDGSVTDPTTVYVTELSFKNRYEFPSIGDSKILYIATDMNKMYRFDETSLNYIVVGSDYEEIELIQGI